MLFGGMRYNLYLCIISYMNKMSKYNNYASVTELSRKERRDLAQFCLDYCIKVLGQPKKKGIPRSVLLRLIRNTMGNMMVKLKRYMCTTTNVVL